MTEHFETRSKKVRGMAQASLDLIEAMAVVAQAAQPINGRGVGYKLFTAGLIPSMDKANMQRVYRLLREAREQGWINWNWIVDETRESRAATPGDYFGGCPTCGVTNGFVNDGADHWFVCDRHKTKWYVGSNLFSNWRDDTAEDRFRNRDLLGSYRQVQAIGASQRPRRE